MKGHAVGRLARTWLVPLLVVAGLLLALLPTSLVTADSVVTFPDPNLRAAIREAIGKPTGDIYQSDLDGLYDLDAGSKGIVDLRGLEHCVNLYQLVLSSNKISDPSPLSRLSLLSWLWLDHNRITSPASIPGTADILDLSHNQIRSLSRFTGGCDTVNLSHNQISDLSGFRGGANILYLSHNQISDLSGFHGRVSWLDLSYNKISDIRPLIEDRVFDSLVGVDLRANPLSSTSMDTYIPVLQSRKVKVEWDSYPKRPVNISPANGATGVSLTPTLVGSAYFESQGDTHVASSWQIRSSTGNYDKPVWESGKSSPAATRITVPAGKLRNGTVYYWRVGYKDSGGLWSSYSAETSFTTIEAAAVPPTVATAAASSIGSTSATLNLKLSSLGSASSVRVCFEWGPGTAYGNTTTPQTMAATGSFSYPLSGLSPGTTYYFRAKAEGAGTSYGRDMTFTTASTPVSPPTVTTSAATGTAMDAATLNGALTYLGTASSVQVSFEWGLTTSYGSITPAKAMAAAGSFSADLSGLAAGTTYHYRAKAVGDDTAYGSDMTFTTSATPTTPPVVATDDADGVTANSARLNGNLTSLGTASSVTVSFVWGPSQGGPYPNETQENVQATSGAFHFDLSGLTPDTTFYYQARAVGDGTSYGVEKSFTTGTASTSGGTPVIASLVANKGRPGDELTVTISGSRFTDATAVGFGEDITVNKFRVISDTEITVKVSIRSGAQAGKRNVTVATPHGTATSLGGFTVTGGGGRVHLWVYLVAAAGGVAVLGIIASVAVWVLRRPPKPAP